MVVAVGSATIGWIIRKSTMDVRQHIAETSAGLERLERTQRNTAVQDSIRFERVMDVVEIAVVAIIEPDGSAEQKSAIEDLRHRRHVVPITP
jgi:hypothetical protein